MSKNIVICLDGTWNDKEDVNALSNVALLHNIVVNDGSRQLSYYDNGVGTSGWYDKKLGGVHGVGLSENIRQAYTFLVQNYQENDKVFIFGFIRGAYTARSLSGLLYQCGLLNNENNLTANVRQLYDAYKDKDQQKTGAHKAANRACPVQFLGVWDTVGALGIPVSFLRNASAKLLNFHDTKLSPEINFACHAVAIDEKRESFQPTLWQESDENKHRIKQVWFAGVHSDVGGGYAERFHSDVALEWMLVQASHHGLVYDGNNDYQFQVDLKENIHSSAYNIFGIDIGVKERDALVVDGHAPKIHWSVREKMKLHANYQPRALAKHIVDTNTLAPYDIEE